MIPVTQTKVSVKNSKNETVVHGNCFASAIASIIERPISEVPNVEVFFHLENNFWQIVMLTFLESIGWDMCTDNRYACFHQDEAEVKLPQEQVEEYKELLKDTYYLVSGDAARGFYHICVYKNGELAHDPHPTKEGLLTHNTFRTLEKIK